MRLLEAGRGSCFGASVLGTSASHPEAGNQLAKVLAGDPVVMALCREAASCTCTKLLSGDSRGRGRSQRGGTTSLESHCSTWTLSPRSGTLVSP